MKKMQSLPEKVHAAIAAYRMLNDQDTVLVGLSGGADSVCLLLCLLELGYPVAAVHINHCLRGAESDRDEAFCQDLCGRLEIPFFCKRVDVSAFCRSHSYSIEEGAREIRYRIYAEAAAELAKVHAGDVKIATAHTLSDNLETVLFRLARGTALKGLCGIPPTRETPPTHSAPAVGGTIIRPLLHCTREETEAYLHSRQQAFVTDSTNLAETCSRNRIRHKIIPVLREINPALHETFLRSLRAFSADEAYLAQQTYKAISAIQKPDGWDAQALLALDPALQTRAVYCLLQEHHCRLNTAKLEELLALCRTGGKINLQGTLFAVCRQNRLQIRMAQPLPEDFEVVLSIGSAINFHGRKLMIREISYPPKDMIFYKKFAKSMMDYDKLKGITVLRNRRAGDKIQLSGRSFTSSVKKLLNAHVPANRRDLLVCIADEQGLIYLEEFGVAARCVPDENTSHCIYLDFMK